MDKKDFLNHFSAETTNFIFNAANGIDEDPVQSRLLPISIGCSKSFRMGNMLNYPENLTDGKVQHWLTELAKELYGRVSR